MIGTSVYECKICESFLPSVSCEKKVFYVFFTKILQTSFKKSIGFQIETYISIEQKKYFISLSISNLVRWQHCACALNVARGCFPIENFCIFMAF